MAIVRELAEAEAGSYGQPVDREPPIDPGVTGRRRYAAGQVVADPALARAWLGFTAAGGFAEGTAAFAG